VGEAHGRRKDNDAHSRETAAAVAGHQSSMKMVSPFHGFRVYVVHIPRVDTHG